MFRLARRLSVALIVVVALSMPFSAQKKGRTGTREADAKASAAIWSDPGSVASLDLIYGVGGKTHAPDPGGTYTFVKEDMAGTSPKFEIRDAQGVRWKVKLGAEPGSETAATRFLWAAGYFVDEDYYLASLKVTGMPTLQRGGKFVLADGTVRRARLERDLPGLKKEGGWNWFANPFTGTRELNGLRIMMSLVNDWDLSEANNSIDQTDGQRRYVVSDLGASFGNTGNSLTRSKGEPRDYAGSTFIDDASGPAIDFVMHSRPFFLGVVNVNNYRDRTRMERVAKHIPRADAQWLGRRLSQLSDEQIRDGFRAGGYAGGDLETYTQTMRKRIAELGAL